MCSSPASKPEKRDRAMPWSCVNPADPAGPAGSRIRRGNRPGINATASPLTHRHNFGVKTGQVNL